MHAVSFSLSIRATHVCSPENATEKQATALLSACRFVEIANAFTLSWEAPKREDFNESETSRVYPTNME
jgi:hypothetical protein